MKDKLQQKIYEETFPYSVSQWEELGKQRAYFQFFEKKIREVERQRIIKILEKELLAGESSKDFKKFKSFQVMLDKGVLKDIFDKINETNNPSRKI